MIKNKNWCIYLGFFFMSLGVACSNEASEFKAENALEGGRYFIENCMKGDFKKARLYLLESPINKNQLDSISAHYFSLDKEQRQQLRQASIQVNEILSIDSTHSSFNYQNSLDKITHSLMIVATPQGWKVDLQYSYDQK